MLRLRDIMTTDVLTVAPETSVREAMELLGRHHVSGAPVIAGGLLVGVVTATDLMTFASSLAGVPTVRDGAEGAPWNGDADVDADDAEPAGMFFTEYWDDAGADTVERESALASPEWNTLEEHTVSEAMTRGPLCTLASDADARQAAELMSTLGIHRVLVVDHGRLVGIVSSLDFARAVARHRLTERTYVFNNDRGFDQRE